MPQSGGCPVSPSQRAADAVADEEREVHVDRAERLSSRDQVGPGGGLEIIEVDVAATQQFGGRVTVVDGEFDGQRSLALSPQQESHLGFPFNRHLMAAAGGCGWIITHPAEKTSSEPQDAGAHGGLTVIGI